MTALQKIILGALLLTIPSSAIAQKRGKLEEEDYLNGSKTLAAFKAAEATARASTVKLLRKDKVFSLGTVISDGYIVVKATELADKFGVLPDLTPDGEGPHAILIQVEAPDGEKVMGELIGYEITDDIGVIKIPEGKLKPVEWASSTGLFQGQWVAAMGRKAASLRVGVISANRRQIDRRGGVIGVLLDTNDDADELGVGVADVSPRGPARRAGIKDGDLIVEIEDREIRSRRQLSRLVGNYDPGQLIAMKIKRGGKVLEVRLILASRSKVFDMLDRNQKMSGKTSVRKAGFTDALQHELPLPPDAMGGPLFTLEGKAVGVNIARQDRVTTYALPGELVQEIAKRIIEDAAARRPATE